MNFAGWALFDVPQAQEVMRSEAASRRWREQVTAIDVWTAIASLPHGQLLRRL
jgi:hypothetical protein